MKNCTITIYGYEHHTETLQAIKLCEHKNIPIKIKNLENRIEVRYLKDQLNSSSFHLPSIFINSEYLGSLQSLKYYLTQ